MALVLLLVFAILLFLGAPILAAMGLGTWASLLTQHMPGYLVGQTAFFGLNNFTLLTIPLFVLAGEIMDKGGISRRLMEWVIQLVGWMPGGMGIAVVLATMLFSGLSGSVNADAAAIGSLMLPPMVEAGYRKEWASAIVAAAAGTGILIPPSITMIVLGTVANLSIKALFLASLGPAALIGLSKAILIWYKAKSGQEATRENVKFSFKKLCTTFVHAIPALLTPVIILGGILSGVFTATEAAVVAVLYALLLSMVVYRELNWKGLQELLVHSVRLAGVVVGLVAAASTIAYVMAYTMVSQTLGDLTGGLVSHYFLFVTAVMILFWILGALMDGTPALIILIPIFMPIAEKAGMNPIHFAIFALAVFGVSLVTPPLGTACFVVTGIAKISIPDLFKPMFPFLVIMFATILLLTYVPAFTLTLPRLLGG